MYILNLYKNRLYGVGYDWDILVVLSLFSWYFYELCYSDFIKSV